MSLLRCSLVVSLWMTWLAGCGAAPPLEGSAPPGTVRVAIALPEPLAADDISRVTLTVSSAARNFTTDLTLTNGVWGGVLGELEQDNHTLLAQAFTASGLLRYQGSLLFGAAPGSDVLVELTLQEVALPPFSNGSPILDSLTATPNPVVPGGAVTLTARVHDPDPGDVLSYAWSAPSGHFSSTTQASTTWTAPTPQGLVVLTLGVSDSRGASYPVSFTVQVAQASTPSRP